MSEPLWPNEHVLPMIGVTGEFGTGKTKFLLGIGKPAKTIIYDLEMSSADCATYVKHGLTRIDVRKEMFQLYPNGYTSEQFFKWWLNHVRSLPASQFDVIAVDPANDLETGLTDYIANRHDEWGFGSSKSFRNMGGVFFGTVKDEWSRMKIDVAMRCQTFAFANHMRDKYVGDESTGEREAKGKDTFMRLSSLYIQLDFKPEDSAPSGTVLKARLDETRFDADGFAYPVPILRKGQRIYPATPRTIRDYILNPIGDRPLEQKEIPQVPTLTEDERLKLEADKARNERISHEKQVEAIKEAKSLESQREEARRRALSIAKPQQDETTKRLEDTDPGFLVNPDDIRTMRTEAERRNTEHDNVELRVICAIQNELGETPTGKLSRGQAKRITPDMLKKYMDGINKIPVPVEN